MCSYWRGISRRHFVAERLEVALGHAREVGALGVHAALGLLFGHVGLGDRSARLLAEVLVHLALLDMPELCHGYNPQLARCDPPWLPQEGHCLGPENNPAEELAATLAKASRTDSSRDFGEANPIAASLYSRESIDVCAANRSNGTLASSASMSSSSCARARHAASAIT